MNEANATLAPALSRVIAALVLQAAVKAVKRRLQAEGIRLARMPMGEINAVAKDYIVGHRSALVAQD